MTDWEATESETRPDTGRPMRSAKDGLLVGRHGVWVLISREDEDPAGMLSCGEEWCDEVPFLVCREVRDNGTVVLGPPDPGQDALMSQVLGREIE